MLTYINQPRTKDERQSGSYAFKNKRNKSLLNACPIHNTDNLESFKTNLDRLLLSFRDTPPISGDDIIYRSLTHCWTDQEIKRDNRMLPGGRLQSTMAYIYS